jgi:hypothetical protein
MLFLHVKIKRMPKQQEEIREIEKYIKSWLLDIDFSTALCYTDINKVSEGICRKLLNLIYGYELEDLGKEQINFPAIDLGDDNLSKISFQVTSETTRDKITESLKKFKNHGLDKRFTGGIKFLILNSERKRRAVIKGYEDIFEMERDVLYIPDLISEISSIYWDDQKKFIEIKDFLKSEFGNPHKKEPSLIFPDELDKIENYIQVVKKLNLAEVSKLAHFVVHKQEELYSTEILFEEPLQNNATVVIGDSGCGKSVAVRAWAISLCDKGTIPLILVAKYFEHGLAALIEKEILPYGFSSALSFISACAASQRKILLVLDGFNECTAEVGELLISEVKELSIRYEILFMITTQQLTKSLEALESMLIKVSKPDHAQKMAIAAKYSGSVNKLEPILRMVSTSMEARMVGEIGEFGVDEISRYSLFELFVRKKLKKEQIEGMHLLSSMARKMSHEISFSLSLRQVDTILRNENISSHIMEACLSTGILEKDFAQISFSHEMLMDFFIADSVTRFNENPEIVIKEFNAPRNDEKKLLIIGSIEDIGLRAAVLESITDSKLLVLLLEGEAGKYCERWAAEKVSLVLAKMTTESTNIKFVINQDRLPAVVIEKDSIPVWTNSELAFIDVIIYQLVKGKLIEEIFLIVGIMDESLERSFKSLLDEAREKKIGLISSLFQAVYNPMNGTSITLLGSSLIFSAFESGFASFYTANGISIEQIKDLAGRSIVQNGQFYLLLLLCRFTIRAGALYNLILEALTKKWDYLPGHLQNEILTSVPYCHNNDAEKKALIEAIRQIQNHSKSTNIFLSSTLFETLDGLGALYDDAENYEGTVLADVDAILSKPDDEHSWREAFSLFDSQFDHPYNSAFSNVLGRLDESSKKAFYTAALRHDDESDSFVKSLIFTAEDVLEEACCPYLLKYANRAMIGTIMPQERLKTYIVVCLIFAKYGYEFKSSIEKTTDPAEKNLFAAGEVLYWINRQDLTDLQIKENSKAALDILFCSSSSYVVDTIKQFQFACYQISYPQHFKNKITFLANAFPDLILSTCQSVLNSGDIQFPIYRFDNQMDILNFAVDQIGAYGDVTDIILLKSIADDLLLGKSAVKAIKNIEKKSKGK